MTGIYGMGNAYNLRFAQRSVVRPQIRPSYPAPPQQGYCGCGHTGSVTIGPRGFFGFMSGFLPSFMMGFGLMGMVTGIVNMFRKPKTPVMYSPSMNMPFYNNINANNSTQASNLKTIADKKGFTVLNNGDGTYTLFDSNNNLVKGAKGISYDKMIDIIGETQGSTKPKETSETEDKEKVAPEAQGSKKAGTTNPDGKATTNEETETNVSESPAASSTSSNQAKAGVSNQSASSVTADNKATEAKANITDTEADDVDANAVSEQVSAKQAKNKPAASKYRKGQDLKGWYKPKDAERKAIDNTVKAFQNKNKNVTAQTIVDVILKSKMDYLSNEDRAKLVKQMIANNPSVFDENGNAYSDGSSQWNKLDIPSVDAIKGKYIKNGTKPTFNIYTKKVTYTNVNNKRVQHTSPNTLKSKQYEVKYDQNGPYLKYANGKILRGNDFKNSHSSEYNKAMAIYRTKNKWLDFN